MTASLFIVYARRDETYARRTARDLRRLGFTVWIDLDFIDPTDADGIESQIYAALAKSDLLIWVARKDTPLTYWTAIELSYGVASERPVRPLAVDVKIAVSDQLRHLAHELGAISSQDPMSTQTCCL